MTISLDLPSELENELSEEASRLKLPLAEYIFRVLAFRPFTQNLPKTGAELVAYWEKVEAIDSRSDITDVSQGWPD
ncbi:MAG: hypothetical protein ACFB8W_22385 [Elainellaceae cyanobacterium]